MQIRPHPPTATASTSSHLTRIPMEDESCNSSQEDLRPRKTQRTHHSTDAIGALFQDAVEKENQETTMTSYHSKQSIRLSIAETGLIISKIRRLIHKKELAGTSSPKEIQKLQAQIDDLKVKKQELKILLEQSRSNKRSRAISSSPESQKIKIQVEIMGEGKIGLEFLGITRLEQKPEFNKKVGIAINMLNLDDCSDVSDADVEKIVNYCPNMTQIFLKSNQITNKSLQLIAKLPYLTHLYISGNITDAGVCAVADKLSRLTQLFINGLITKTSLALVLNRRAAYPYPLPPVDHNFVKHSPRGHLQLKEK